MKCTICKQDKDVVISGVQDKNMKICQQCVELEFNKLCQDMKAEEAREILFGKYRIESLVHEMVKQRELNEIVIIHPNLEVEKMFVG